MRRSWKFWLLAVLALFVCVAVWLEPTEDDLFELCSTQGKPVIYRSVEAEGYYYGTTDDCWNCWMYLENTGYKFIEFSLDEARPDYMPINLPGVYRVSRIHAASEDCNSELTDYYKKTKMAKEIMDANNWCFGLESFEVRQARFGRYIEDLGVIASSSVTGSKINSKRAYWLDHLQNEVIADFTDFSLTSFPTVLFSSFRTRQHCNSFVNELGPRGIDNQKVIVP